MQSEAQMIRGDTSGHAELSRQKPPRPLVNFLGLTFSFWSLACVPRSTELFYGHPAPSTALPFPLAEARL